jgi:hypothetical protein
MCIFQCVTGLATATEDYHDETGALTDPKCPERGERDETHRRWWLGALRNSNGCNVPAHTPLIPAMQFGNFGSGVAPSAPVYPLLLH